MNRRFPWNNEEKELLKSKNSDEFLEKKISEFFESKKVKFHARQKFVVNKNVLIKEEINICRTEKDNKGSHIHKGVHSPLGDIDLYPIFIKGWDIMGNGIELNYDTLGFHNVSIKVVLEKLAEGMGHAKYLHWLEELLKDEAQETNNDFIQEMPQDIKLRHSILLLYEFGIVEHIETELKNRGINLAQVNRNYVPSLLAVLMNITDKASQETIRKEISQHSNIKPPINTLNKLLATFGLEIQKLNKQ
jgi:hypothetical protein